MRFSYPVRQLPLRVLLVRAHLRHVQGRDGAHVAHAVRRIAREQQEQLARARQLVAEPVQPHVHPVLRVAPEAVDERLHFGCCLYSRLIFAAQAYALAHHVVRRQRDDPPRQGVSAPGLQRLLQVAPRLVPGTVLGAQAHLLPPAVVHLSHRLGHPLLDVGAEEPLRQPRPHPFPLTPDQLPIACPMLSHHCRYPSSFACETDVRRQVGHQRQPGHPGEPRPQRLRERPQVALRP